MRKTHIEGALSGRDPSFVATDAQAVRWIAQAAINVELFTIPLYMTSLYSISGMHPITGQGSDFYKGRQWPGAKPSAVAESDRSRAGWGNKQAFNIIFSVFIQEMLHLQMAANLATATGVSPSFTSGALQSPDHGWTCYGADLHAIPNIVDLRDTSTYEHVKVDVGPVNNDTVQLFLAIEQSHEAAEADIVRNTGQYFPPVPFDPATSLDSIKFGSIGYMYQCYRDYLSITYSDGTRLWDHVFTPNGQQNDMFNSFSFPGHPMREYMGVETTIALTDKDIAFRQALEMMNAITDQGEGSTLKPRLRAANAVSLQNQVEKRYCPDPDALRSDYPSFSDTGEQIPSADAAARLENDGRDHFERFEEVQALLDQGGILTWDQAGKAGKWTAAELVTADYEPVDCGPLPTPDQIAQALNNLYSNDRDRNHKLLSQAVVGAIKGVTTVLDQYWNPAAPGSTVGFPYPSMVGSGDRMSIAWAVFGTTPDLSVGIPPADTKVLNHACQGLSLKAEQGKVGANSCAETPIFHSCRGSNLCKGMGGCGFVQASTGGGSGCGGSVAAAEPTPGVVGGQGCSAVQMRVYGGSCGGPPAPPGPGDTVYTAPSDNICGGFGGCAVPISACQVYPKSGTMEVYVLAGSPPPAPTPPAPPAAAVGANLCGGPPPPHNCGSSPSRKIGTIPFAKGEKVEDIAFRAFAMVAEELNYPAPVQQDPNDLRLAFPPST
jgi:Ferritin-like